MDYFTETLQWELLLHTLHLLEQHVAWLEDFFDLSKLLCSYILKGPSDKLFLG